MNYLHYSAGKHVNVFSISNCLFLSGVPTINSAQHTFGSPYICPVSICVSSHSRSLLLSLVLPRVSCHLGFSNSSPALHSACVSISHQQSRLLVLLTITPRQWSLSA
ncbi:hypothetical protein CEXT_30141 [Caerostris extrusa]|uniref:Uncharacterized protein n=1 Tax=Caerostris extrusa TaxID=172846 RepID=A0AAV4M3V6_CAEEX|nr:hypothetical protein CEXT_30141 [Caerostris extrusa]